MGRSAQGTSSRNIRYKVIPRTLCFLTRGDELLLLRGSPHKKLWPNLLNGVGGHVEGDEDVYSAAIREVREETGLNVTNLQLVAVVQINAGEPGVGVLVFVFKGPATSEPPVASTEGTLEWVSVTALPCDELVEDLPILLPRILSLGPSDPPVFGYYTYDPGDHLVASFFGEATSVSPPPCQTGANS